MHCIISRSNRGVVLRALSLGRFRRYDNRARHAYVVTFDYPHAHNFHLRHPHVSYECRVSNLHEPVCREVMTIVLSQTRAVKIDATGVAWVCILESTPYLGQVCCLFSFSISCMVQGSKKTPVRSSGTRRFFLWANNVLTSLVLSLVTKSLARASKQWPLASKM